MESHSHPDDANEANNKIVDAFKLNDFQNVKNNIYKYPNLIRKTAILDGMKHLFGVDHVKNLKLKLETMQITGSFKIRGAINQFINLSDQNSSLVTMSAGNYGKAFACVAKEFGRNATVFMPVTSPLNRKDTIESYGANVCLCEKTDLQAKVDKHIEEHGSIFLHPFEDKDLIIAHGSAGIELFEDIKDEPDIVLVCCGGGGLVSGVSAALRLSGWTSTKIYGVETQNSPRMSEALKAGQPVDCQTKYSVATGLCPPYVGELTSKCISKFSNGILTVPEEDLIRATKLFYSNGLVVEPSGAACVAALISGKVPDSAGKSIVAFVTGGNVTLEELVKLQ